MTLPRRSRQVRTHHEPLESLNPRSIALVQLGKLGDMILTTPLFHALRETYPEAGITLIAAQSSAMLPQSQTVLDHVLAVPRGLLRQVPMVASRLRASRFDLYIDVKDHRSTTSRLLAELVRAGHRIAHRSVIDEEGTPLPEPAAPGHYVDRALAPMQLLAPGRTFRRRPKLAIPLEAYLAVDDQLDPGERGMIAINISAGDRSRYWNPAGWKQLIGDLSRRYSIAVLSSPADRALADEICTTRKGARPIRTENLLEAAAVVDRAAAVISPDTSIIHLASARNRPTLGLYPPSLANATAFAPLADRFRIVMPAEDATIADITVREVLGTFEELMENG